MDKFSFEFGAIGSNAINIVNVGNCYLFEVTEDNRHKVGLYTTAEELISLRDKLNELVGDFSAPTCHHEFVHNSSHCAEMSCFNYIEKHKSITSCEGPRLLLVVRTSNGY